MAIHRLNIPAALDEIESVCKTVDSAAIASLFDERASYICQLAVSEACENVIKHGYGKNKEGRISITIRSHPGKLVIELCDDAPPFNPAKKPKSVKIDKNNPPVGGLGIPIMHRAMDEVKYRRRAERNYLKLVKTHSSP
jgi:anti-sigma regulatory factor (Ser/Thr protein kinase)